MVKRKIQYKKAYTDEATGMTHIPIKLKGKKKFKCDDCGKKVREVFTINPCELLLRRELCRGCYVKTPESLEYLLGMVEDIKEGIKEVKKEFSFIVKDGFLDNLGEPYELDEGNTEKNLDEHDLTVISKKEGDSDIFVYVCDKCNETLDLEMECEVAKIPFEGTWSCICGNVIKVKWDGKELKYL